MGRRILITSLGTGKLDEKIKDKREYVKTNYSIEGKIYENREYISSALEEHYGIDKVFYIGTLGSMWENIYVHYCRKFKVKQDENYWLELTEKIDNFNRISLKEKQKLSLDYINFDEFKRTFNEKVIPVLTYIGVNEEEINENFSRMTEIFDNFQDGDELYLDITHSFRSNAFWTFLVLNYIENMKYDNKKIEVKKITYGMFELKEKNSEGKEISPVIDLTTFSTLLNWMKAGHNFKKYGNADDLERLITNQNTKQVINNYSKALSMNYIEDIGKSVNAIKKLDTKSLIGPEKFIIPQVKEEVERHFRKWNELENINKMIQLAEWHYNEKRYALTYLNLNQALDTFLEEGLKNLKYFGGNKVKKTEKRKRFFVQIINTKNKYKEEENKLLIEFQENTFYINESRNNIAHSDNKKINIEEDIKRIPRLIKFCKDNFNKENYLENLIKELSKYGKIEN